MPTSFTFEELTAEPKSFTFEELSQPEFSTNPVTDADSRAAHKAALQYAQQNLETDEPRSNATKARFSFAAGAAKNTADAMTYAGRLLDLFEPKLHGKYNPPPMQIGTTAADYWSKVPRELGDAAQTVADATPGNELLSTVAQGAGSMVPGAMVSPLGVAASVGVSALSQAGSTHDEAKKYLVGLGMSEEESEPLAMQVGAVSGAITGAVTRYTPKILGKLPGVGKYLADEGVESALKPVLLAYLKKRPGWADVAKHVAGAMGSESLEEGSDQTLQAALSLKTNRPDLTWDQALKEIGIAALAGGLTAGAIRGPMIAAQQASGATGARWDAAKQQERADAVTATRASALREDDRLAQEQASRFTPATLRVQEQPVIQLTNQENNLQARQAAVGILDKMLAGDNSTSQGERQWLFETFAQPYFTETGINPRDPASSGWMQKLRDTLEATVTQESESLRGDRETARLREASALVAGLTPTTQPQEPNAIDQIVEQSGVPQQRAGTDAQRQDAETVASDQLLATAPVTEPQAEAAPDAAKPVAVPSVTPIGDLVGRTVTYTGVTGTLGTDTEGTVIVTPAKGPIIEVAEAQKDLTKTAGSLGISHSRIPSPPPPRNVPVLNQDGTVTLGEVIYSLPPNPSEAFQKDNAGNVVSVRLVDPTGKPITVRDQEAALDIAIAVANRAAAQRTATDTAHSGRVDTAADAARGTEPDWYRDMNPVTEAVERVLSRPARSIFRQDITPEQSDTAKKNLNFLIDRINGASMPDARKRQLTKPLFELWDKIEAYERLRSTVPNAPETAPVAQGATVVRAGASEQGAATTAEVLGRALRRPRTRRTPVQASELSPKPTATEPATAAETVSPQVASNETLPGDTKPANEPASRVPETATAPAATPAGTETATGTASATVTRAAGAGTETEPFSLTDTAAATPLTPDAARSVAVTFATENPNAPRVHVINDPNLMRNGQFVQGYLAADGSLVLNAAHVGSEAEAVQILREEWAHWNLATAEGRQKLAEFAAQYLTEADLAELSRQYTQGRSETNERYQERLQNEWLAKQAREKPSWWTQFLDRIKQWLNSLGIRNLTRDEAARALLRSFTGDGHVTLEPGSEMLMSLTAKEYKAIVEAMPPDLDPNDRESYLNRMFGPHHFAGTVLEPQFAQLPEAVKKELEPIAENIKTAAAARADLATVPPGQTLKEFADNSSPDAPKRAAVMLEGARSILGVIDHEQTVQNRIARTTGSLNASIEAEANADHVETAKKEIVSATLRSLTGSASQAADPLEKQRFEQQIEYIRNRDGAVKLLTKGLVDSIPEAGLTAPGTNRASIAKWVGDWLDANLDIVRGSQDMPLATLFTQLVRDTPDIVQLLRVAKGTDPSAETKAVTKLRDTLKTQEDALKFIREEVRTNPQFDASYRQALEFADISDRLIGEVESDPNKFRFPNPYDPTQFAEILPDDLNHENWLRNRSEYEKALNWYTRYASDPAQDPSKRSAAVAAISKIVLEMNQSVAPAEGRVTPHGTFNPFYQAMRYSMGWMDIPRAALEFIGGRMSLKAMQNLINRAVVGERMNSIHRVMRGDVFAVTLDAAKAAGFKGTHNQAVFAWAEQIGNPILRSYQTQNDRRYTVGHKVNGHIITKADMDALKAQVRYARAQLAAVESLWKGDAALVSGIYSPLRVQETIGNKRVERRAVDFTGMLMPLHYISARSAFETAIADPNKNPETVINAQENWLPVLSHAQSYSDATYRVQNESPFVDQYRAISRQIDETGDAPKNLDELAGRIFDLRASDPDAEQMSIPDIKKRFINEIKTVFSAWKQENDATPTLVQDTPRVTVVKADNFLNKPRTERLLPKGFYSYTVGTEEEMYGIRRAALDIYAHRFLHDGYQLLDALQAKETQFRNRKQSQKETEKLMQDGTELVSLDEANKFGIMLGRTLKKFKDHLEKAQEAEQDMSSVANMTRGWLSHLLLSRFGTIVRNFNGGILQRALMENELYRYQKNAFNRMWLVHPIAATSKAAFRQGESSLKMLVGLVGNTDKGKLIREAISRNPALYAQWIGTMQQFVDRQAERVERMQEQGIVNESNAVENFLNQWKLLSQRGQLTKDLSDPSLIRKALRSTAGLMEMAIEVSVPLTLPRALASQLADNAVNSTAEMYVNDDLATLHMRSVSALDNRARLGIPAGATQDTLSPQEVFGLTGKSHPDMNRALAAVRNEWARAGLSLDQYLLDFYAAVLRERASRSTTTTDAYGTTTITRGTPKEVSILTQAQRNSLINAWATRLNKGTIADRPVLNSPGARMAGMFMGYAVNQNAQYAKMSGKWSRDTRRFRAEALTNAAFILAATGLMGIVTYPVTEWLEWWLLRKAKPIKSLKDTESVGDFTATALRQSAPFLPVIGNVLNNMAGQITQTGGLMGSGISLLPISLAKSTIKTLSKGFQTGDWSLVTSEFIKQWIPNSSGIMHLIGVQEGTTNEAAMRAAIAANAPSSLEVRPYNQAAATKYSPISANLQRIRDALSRTGGPDLATVTTEREAAVAKLMSLGQSRESAAKAVDAAVLASSPYRTVFGREPTERERTQLEAGYNETQRQIVRTVESGRQAYAQAFGRPSPDFTSLKGKAVEAEASRLGLPSPAASSGGYRGRSGSRFARSGTGSWLRLRRGTVTRVRSPRLRSGRTKLALRRSRGVRSQRYARTSRSTRSARA